MLTTSRNRQSSFLLSATVDFPDDVRYGLYSFELLDELMVQLRSLGVSRIYWLYYYDIDPDSDWAGTIFQRMKYGADTLKAIGEPLKAAVPSAHKHGMELYAVLKPYHTGTWGSYPEGSPEAEAAEIKRIGDTPVQAIPFVERHPHTRIRRRPLKAPPDLQSLPVKKIRLLKKDDSPTRIRRENLEIWTSLDNYRYQQRDVAFTLKEKVEPAPREVRDYYGNLVTAQGAAVRTLTLEGLHLTDPYILITTNFKDEKGDFRNTALGMLEVYGSGPEPLPIVVATRSAIVRDSPRDFRSSGLAFDSGLGPLQVDLDVDPPTEPIPTNRMPMVLTSRSWRNTASDLGRTLWRTTPICGVWPKYGVNTTPPSCAKPAGVSARPGRRCKFTCLPKLFGATPARAS